MFYTVLKGSHKMFWDVFNTGSRSFSHAEGGGGNKFSAFKS